MNATAICSLGQSYDARATLLVQMSGADTLSVANNLLAVPAFNETAIRQPLHGEISLFITRIYINAILRVSGGPMGS